MSGIAALDRREEPLKCRVIARIPIGVDTIVVRISDLGEDTYGEWLFDNREIRLNRRLLPRPMRSTLVHEAAHAASDILELNWDESTVRAIELIMAPIIDRAFSRIHALQEDNGHSRSESESE